MKRFFALAALLLAVLFLRPSLVAAQEPAEVIAAAQAAIARGDLEGAEVLLASVEDAPAVRNDLDFLHGIIAVERQDYVSAVARFKALLTREPSLNRVRLELARAYFLRGDDRSATYYFQAALVQGVPPAVERSIGTFLDAMRRRKRWDATVFLAAVPDTNINASTAAQSVDIFGLPFELSDTARRRSGVGFAANVSAAYLWDLTPTIKLRTGATFYDTEYSRRAFTDRQLGLYSGPRFQLAKDTEMSVLGTVARRWYGEVPLTTGAGGRVEIRSVLSPRWLAEGVLTGQYLHYNAARYPSYSGPAFGVAASVTYAVSPISLVTMNAGVVREQTAVAAFRNYQYTGGGGYYREGLPARFTLFGGVQANVARYDAALGAFAAVRRDLELSYRLSLSNKYVDVLGFRPVLSFVHTDRTSNIPLYSYHRNRGEVGMVRNY